MVQPAPEVDNNESSFTLCRSTVIHSYIYNYMKLHHNDRTVCRSSWYFAKLTHILIRSFQVDVVKVGFCSVRVLVVGAGRSTSVFVLC